MKIYDITLPIHNNMMVWRGDSKVTISQSATIEEDEVALSHFSFGSHTGTHVDAPSHFVKDGSNIDSIDLQKLIGPCRVLDVTTIDHLEITPNDLNHFNIQKGERVLFKTGNYKFLKESEFPDSYVSLSQDAAEYLVEKGVVLVGIDFLGIEKEKNPGHPVHTTLLKAGIVNVEGLDLSLVPSGDYQLICLPLKVSVDGSPARVVLVEN